MRSAWSITLCALLVCIFIVQIKQVDVLERVANNVSPIVQTGLNTTWTSGGQTVVVHTDPEPGESDASLLVRHTAAVKAKLAEKPIDHPLSPGNH